MMKRLLSIAVVCLLTIPAVFANNFEFRFHGAAVADGATVTIAAAENAFGEIACETNPFDNPSNGLVLSLLSGTSASCTATITIDQNTLNPGVVQWCMGGTCSIFNANTSLTKTFNVANGAENVQFDASSFQGDGVLMATLTATINDETHSVKIKFTNGDTGEVDGLWWGYFGGSDTQSSNFTGIGHSGAETLEAAIRIPKGDAIMGNATINGMRLWLKENTISKITSLKIWATSTALKNNAQNVDYVQEVDLSTLKAGANDIIFTTPYAIVNTKNNNFGYTITLSADAEAIMCGGEWVENSFWFRAAPGSTTWTQKKTNGKLALQLLAEGVNVPDNAAIIDDFGTHYFKTGDEAIIPVVITNKGKNAISSIAYTVTTDNDPSTTTPEVTVPIDDIDYNSIATLNITFDTSVPANYLKTITITKVNGEENGIQAPENNADGRIVVKAYLFTSVPVVEELTSTGCGWCPVGFDGMEKTHEKYGDKVALIAIHRNFNKADPMVIPDYNALETEGYPNSYVNRSGEDIYPAESYLQEEIEKCLKEHPDGMVEVTAQWNDEAMTNINIETDTKFAFNMTDANYGVALVLTNDGLHGTSSGWTQVNYLSHYAGYESYSYWYNAPAQATGVVFNHVAVAAWNVMTGFDGSVKSSFEAGESMKFNYLADITSKSVIQDKSQLNVIALLIDRSTGKIVNAGQTKIKPFGNVVPGDVNGDGECTSSDVTALYNAILYNDFSKVVNGDQNGDNEVTSSDVTAVYNIILGL